MNDDDGLPGWEQQENDERRRREDEALVHCRKITAQSKRECAEFAENTKNFWNHIRQETQRAKSK